MLKKHLYLRPLPFSVMSFWTRGTITDKVHYCTNYRYRPNSSSSRRPYLISFGRRLKYSWHGIICGTSAGRTWERKNRNFVFQALFYTAAVCQMLHYLAPALVILILKRKVRTVNFLTLKDYMWNKISANTDSTCKVRASCTHANLYFLPGDHSKWEHFVMKNS